MNTGNSIRFVAVALMMFATQGCDRKDPPSPQGPAPGNDVTAKLGLVYSATGELAAFGKPVHDAVVQAVEEINAAGGMGGQKLELVAVDDGSEPARARDAMEKLITSSKPIAIIGPTSSSATRLTADVAQKHGVVQITPTGHDVDLASLPNTFILFPTVEQVAEKLAEFAATRFKAKKVVTISPKNEWGEQSNKALQSGLEKLGSQLVASEPFAEGDTEFAGAVKRALAHKPDVVIYPGYYDRETLALTKEIVANPAARDIIIIISGATCELLLRDPILENEAFRKNIFIVEESGGFVTPNGEQSKFQQAFRDRNQYRPNAYAAAAHAAVTAIAQAHAANAGDVGAALRAGRVETVFGPVQFDSSSGLNQSAVVALTQANAEHELVMVQ
jgi:branched-chain amino acid transport system substrate-binding protein